MNEEWSNWSETGIFLRARDNRDAMFHLYQRVRSTLSATARAKLGDNYSDIEDALQTTFTDALQHAERFDQGSGLRKWLKAITKNVCLVMLRQRRRTEPMAEEFDVEGKEEDPQAVAEREMRERVQDLLDDLPEPLRVALELRYYEGLKIEEIGERLGIKKDAVLDRLAKGNQLLRERLGPDAAPGD